MAPPNQPIVLEEYTPDDPTGWLIKVDNQFIKIYRETKIKVPEDEKFYLVLDAINPFMEKLSPDVKKRVSDCIADNEDEFQAGNYQKLKNALKFCLTESYGLENANIIGVVANNGGEFTADKEINISVPKNQQTDSKRKEVVGSVLNKNAKVKFGDKVNIKVQGNLAEKEEESSKMDQSSVVNLNVL